ncbi:MAG: pyridoxal phosphate-dependent aminotransferase, partial [Nitrososphaeraceae archaeon]|nr:pyridoxal phosphate-dependent aminotransferase [Nitrososphaeraceae archaeon]
MNCISKVVKNYPVDGIRHMSKVAESYQRSGIRVMFDLAAQYHDLINFGVGEPNFETPNHIKESAKKAIDEGLTHYEPNAGMLGLRQTIASKYKREFGYECTTENVMITIGGTEANFLTLMTIINPGDEVIITNPHYPSYFGHIKLVGGKVVLAPVYEENEFKLMPEDLEKAITPKTKDIFLNYPNNPIGAVLTKEDFEALAKVVKKYDLMVISDEVYEKIYFDGYTHFSMSQIPEVRNNILITNSFSKTYAMTGWRIGYIVGDKKFISQMQKIQEGIVSCVPGFIQRAAIDAINGPQDVVGQMVVDYTRRRNILIDGINAIPGIKCMKSPGSIYAFPNIKSFGKKSVDFAMELLKEAGVVSVPGSAFGSMGEGYLRFCFGLSDENLRE